jgi:hypothetical protein
VIFFSSVQDPHEQADAPQSLTFLKKFYRRLMSLTVKMQP